jgi:CRP-like cAMP-binding protein
MEYTANGPLSHDLEDALMYLPRKPPATYRRGMMIFDEQHPPVGFYLVVEGRVKVTVNLEDGSDTVIDILSADDFLGENSLLGSFDHSLRARALDDVSLMSWTIREIEDQSERQPKLGIALIQMLVKRGLDYQTRLQSFALDKTPERVVRCLLHFGDRMGTPVQDGRINIPPFTHQVIAQYVGTTREIVSFQMNQLRHRGLLRYSRKGIQIDPKAMHHHLRTVGHLDAESPGIASQASPTAELRF